MTGITQHGVTPKDIAPFFGYDSRRLSNDDYVARLYCNAIGRSSTSAERAPWVSLLGRRTQPGGSMQFLAESAAGVTRTAVEVRLIGTRFGMLRRARTARELADNKVRSRANLTAYPQETAGYARRF